MVVDPEDWAGIRAEAGGRAARCKVFFVYGNGHIPFFVTILHIFKIFFPK